MFSIGVAAVVGLGAGSVLASGSQQTPAQHAATLAASWNIDGDAGGWRLASLVQVVGFVWTDDDRPVPYPRLVIRDLTDGTIVGTTIGTERGEFRFEGLRAGTYVIELLDRGAAPVTYGLAPSADGVNRFDLDPAGLPADARRTGIPMVSDRVLAVSHPLTVVAGDTVGTFLRVSGSIQPDLVFGAGSSIFESAGVALVGGAGGSNPVSSER